MDIEKNIQLKNIKHLESRSEETHCYSASLYFKGRKVAEVGNSGHGGPDDLHVIDEQALQEVGEYLLPLSQKSYSDWCKKHGLEEKHTDRRNTSIDDAIEWFCCKQVNEWLLKKDLKKMLRKVTALDKKGQLVQWKKPRAVQMTIKEYAKHIQEQKPDVQVLNLMPESLQLQVYREWAGV
jgi:hypothetical protein